MENATSTIYWRNLFQTLQKGYSWNSEAIETNPEGTWNKKTEEEKEKEKKRKENTIHPIDSEIAEPSV